MRISLFLIPLPVLGLPGPKHGRRSTPVSWWPQSGSPSGSPNSPEATNRSSTPQHWPTPNLSSLNPTLDTPRSSGPPIPSESLPPSASSSAFDSSLPPGSETLDKPVSRSPTRSHTPKVPSAAGTSLSLSSDQTLSPQISPTSSRVIHSSSKKGSDPQTSSTRDPQNESSGSTSSMKNHLSSAAATNPSSQSSSTRKALSPPTGPTRSISPDTSSTWKSHSPSKPSLSPAGAPNSTSSDKFNSPGGTHAGPKPPTIPSSTNSRSVSPGKAPVQTLSKAETTDGKNNPSATGGPTISAGSQTTVSETTETVNVITPDPSSVTVSETETVKGVEFNTIFKTEKDGHETSIPILFGSGCLIFCHSGALLLWGIGPGSGKFELPPPPKIGPFPKGPLPKFIEIKGGIPTPVGTQGSDPEDPEPTEDLTSQVEESSATSGSTTSESSTTETSTIESSMEESSMEESSTEESSTAESSTTESSSTESTSSCTRATITNCDVTTSCGRKTCSTITGCEPTVTDCSAAGTTVSTTTSEQYELTMAVYTGHGSATQSTSSTPASSSPPYELTMAVYTGHGSGSPSPSSNATSENHKLTMDVYTGHGSGSPSPSSTPSSHPYQLTMAEYTGHGSGSPSPSSTPASHSYQLTMEVYTGHGSGSPSPSSNATSGSYELTMAEYTGHGSATGSPLSNATSGSYDLTMAEYTGHNLTSSTFRTYKITTTKETGTETTQLCVPVVDNSGKAEGACLCSSGKHTTTLPYFDATSDLCGYTSFPNPEPAKTTTLSSEKKELGLPAGKPSCYPKPDDGKAYKMIELAEPPVKVERWCEDPEGFLQSSNDSPRDDYIEAGWTLDDDAPKQCDELPTTESDSEAYWVCKVALEMIARDCPWMGGTIDTPCGEFHLRGCIGPCAHL